jgi:AcrR family transcriptional regulator
MPAPLALPHGRHRLSRGQVATIQRERILAALAEVTYERGYAALSVEEITKSAGVSRKAFYSQFRDRQQAASEAHELFFQQGMTAAATAFFAPAPNWPERVWAGGRALAFFFAAHPQNAYLSFVETHAIGAPAVQQTYDRLMAFTLFLEEGYHYRPEAEGLPRLCSEALAAVMFESAHRVTRRGRGAEGLVEIVPQLIYLCLAPFMGPVAAGEFVEGKIRAAFPTDSQSPC